MTDTTSTPSPDEETRPFGAAGAGQQTLDPEAPAATSDAPGPAAGGPYPGPYPGPYVPPYAGPGGQPAGYPAYPGYPGYPPAEHPRFRDQVLGMRAVIAVALVALVIGGLGGALLGALSAGGDDGRFGGPPGAFGQGGFGQGGFGQGQQPHQGQLPGQQFQQNQP